MFDRYTERARQVVILARDEARNMRSERVGSDHLLLGLLREEEGIAARVLQDLDVTVERVRREMVPPPPESSATDDEYFGSELEFNQAAKKALEYSLREALSLGHNYIGTEHILLGLLRVDCDAHWTLLHLSDRAEDEIREEVIRMLSGPPKQAPTPGVYAEDTAVFTFTRGGQVFGWESSGAQEDSCSAADELSAEVYDLRDAILKAIGWMAADDHYMAFETLVCAVRPYTD